MKLKFQHTWLCMTKINGNSESTDAANVAVLTNRGESSFNSFINSTILQLNNYLTKVTVP